MGRVSSFIAEIAHSKTSARTGFGELRSIILGADTRLIELALAMVKVLWGSLVLYTMPLWGVGMLLVALMQVAGLIKRNRQIRLAATMLASPLWGYMGYILSTTDGPGEWLMTFVVLINIVLSLRLGRDTKSG